MNAWNTLWGSNDLKNIGITTALTTAPCTWTVNYYEGPNHANTTAGKRNLVDTTVLFTPKGRINLYLNGDYGRDGHIVGHGHDTWYGLAGAARIQITNKIALSPRLEFFNDRNGFETGVTQILSEGTLTGEYKYSGHWIGRLEYRHDSSNRMFFNRGAQPARSTEMTTATLGIMYVFGPTAGKPEGF